ncbi:unnamed protein product [Pedinophyceae sp. YPF-701]|nr:unnamed protein product [Pedinophyceae sp. YPF-701]
MDVLLQCVHQSHAHRLVMFHRQRARHLFPDDSFGTAASEPGYFSSRTGPQLCLLTGVTRTPAEVLRWLRDTHLERYVTRLYFFPHDGPRAATREDLLEQLNGLEAPLGAVRVLATPGGRLLNYVGEHLAMSWELDPKQYEWVLQVAEIPEEAGDGADGPARPFRWHLAPAAWGHMSPNDLSARHDGSACKAAAKIEEAFAFAGAAEDLDAANAIDIGAAPGAWTQYLARTCRRVVAIDPAELSPEVLALPNVVHAKKRVEAAREDVLAAFGGPADVLVCDANIHPADLGGVLAESMGLVRPGGLVVVTLKWRGVSRDKACAEGEFLARVGRGVLRGRACAG